MTKHIHIHVHSRGRVKTIDLAPPPTLAEQYQNLTERLMAALERSGHKTTDDAEDPTGHWLTINGAHVFVNGAGQVTKGPAHFIGKHKDDLITKPTTAKAKGVKAIVHELLTSGHQFHFDELKKATGAKLDQQLHNAINELKAGKGPLGQLMIQKVGPKHYQVVNGQGEPVAPLEGPAPADAVPAAPKAPQEPETPAETAPVTPQAPVSAPSEPEAPATPTLMNKADADATYADAMHELNSDVMSQAFGKMHSPQTLKDLAYQWKHGKASAMAQWATNVKGVQHEPQKVEVFPEDVDLVTKLGQAGNIDFLDQGEQKQHFDKLISEWKTATAKAKAAKNAPAVTNLDAPKPPAEDVPTGGHVLPTPDQIVPDDHQDITPDVFLNDEFVSEKAKVHQILHASASADAVANKKAIQDRLDARLKESPHFARMQEQYGKTTSLHGGSLAARLISAWAQSSGDHHSISVASQLAIRDAFKMDPGKTSTDAFHSLASVSGDEHAVYKQAAQELGIDVKSPEKMESFQAGLRDFALAQYHETQAHLAKHGIKHLYLVRGMDIGHNSSTKPQPAKVTMQPASSFSTNFNTAKGFSKGKTLFMVKVPASQVMSSFATGYGCTNESEVVVLNHPNMKSVMVGVDHAKTEAQAVQSIGAQLGGGKLPDKPVLSSPPMPKAGINTANAALIKQAYKTGDLAEMKKVVDQMMAKNAPKSQAYAKQVMQLLKAQIQAHKLKLAEFGQGEYADKGKFAAAPKAPADQPQVKKNAHYYKKLKEKILAHPKHSEQAYTAAKAKGMTNEQVLAHYDQK